MNTFAKLDNRYIFTGTLMSTEAMHIGSGEGDVRSDSTFVKSNGNFHIPGSSLRGVFRSTVERIVASLGDHTCLLSPNDQEKCITISRDTQEKYKEKVGKGEKDLDLVKWLSEKNRLCKTCNVFGSTHYASKVRIADLPLININSQAIQPEGIIRTGNFIDRDTETASDGALFDFEVIEKGFQFQFEIIAENLEGDDFGILSLGLQELLIGNITIGARASVGLGKCQLNDDVSIQFFDNNDHKFTLKKYLEDDEMGVLPVGWIKGRVKEYLSGVFKMKG
ncbi:MAG: CRISPR-associated RAMP protein Csx7 [Candidatus Scalindua sp.]|nr:CRISPR-associated RAMP protein Csx7 [Candidatus Scalindua sp.]